MRIKPPRPEAVERVCDAILGIRALTVLEGAVRSGKTVYSLMAFAAYITESEETAFLMSGNTLGTLERNCIYNEFGILAILGLTRKAYGRVGESRAIVFTDEKHREKTVFVAGASDSSSFKAIRGMTIGGWYADEIDQHDREFIVEAMKRSAASNDRRQYWNLNPGNPRHWIYTDFIDKYDNYSEREKEDFGGFALFHFIPKDNPEMTARKIRALEAQYGDPSSYLYRRYVLGERCIAEGLIYALPTSSFFRDLSSEMWEDGHRRKMPNGRDLIDVRFCGIDFGADHPTVMTFGGFFGGTKTDFRIVSAYCDERSGKTTYDHYLGFLDQCAKLGIEPSKVSIAIDPAAKVLRDEFLKHGLSVIKAKNDVLPGISFVRDCLALGRFTFDISLVQHRDEFGTYSWDAKAAQSGVEKPVKVGDDCMDSLRYLAYTFVYPYFR